MKEVTTEQRRLSVDTSVRNNRGLKSVALIDQFMPQIQAIAAGIQIPLMDGFQWADLEAIGLQVRPLMGLISQATELSGEQKKQFVKDAIWILYKAVDNGPDGIENNIDLPYIPGIFEKKVEEFLVPAIAGILVESLFPVLRERGEI